MDDEEEKEEEFGNKNAILEQWVNQNKKLKKKIWKNNNNNNKRTILKDKTEFCYWNNKSKKKKKWKKMRKKIVKKNIFNFNQIYYPMYSKLKHRLVVIFAVWTIHWIRGHNLTNVSKPDQTPINCLKLNKNRKKTAFHSLPITVDLNKKRDHRSLCVVICSFWVPIYS